MNAPAKMDIRFSGFERGRNNLLAVQFAIFGSGPLAGVMIAETTSAPVFRSYGAALKGARRALAKVNATGKFPNMCKGF